MVLEKFAPAEHSPLVLRDVPPPKPGPGEILVKVSCCAVCRTDLHVIEGDLPREKLPIVPGHQVVGTVADFGPGCTRLKPGERVGIAWLRHTCGLCEYCRAGRENLCTKQRFTGYHEDGGYAEFAVVPEEFAYRIPAGLSDLHAVPLLCAGIIGYRALNRAQLPEGGKLALFGFGSSAHIVLQLARYRGSEVWAVSRSENHRKLALTMGAVWAGDGATNLPAKMDSAIVFAPAGELLPEALSVLKRGGTVSLAGIHMTDIPAMSYEDHLFYERNVHSVTANTREDGRELLAEAARIPVRPHVTTYALENANRALQDLKSDRMMGTGVLAVR